MGYKFNPLTQKLDYVNDRLNSFEETSKNLDTQPYAINYIDGVVTSIVYPTTTKTFNYDVNGNILSIVLSGTDLPDLTTKTFNYFEGNISSIAYS